MLWRIRLNEKTGQAAAAEADTSKQRRRKKPHKQSLGAGAGKGGSFPGARQNQANHRQAKVRCDSCDVPGARSTHHRSLSTPRLLHTLILPLFPPLSLSLSLSVGLAWHVAWRCLCTAKHTLIIMCLFLWWRWDCPWMLERCWNCATDW